VLLLAWSGKQDGVHFEEVWGSKGIFLSIRFCVVSLLTGVYLVIIFDEGLTFVLALEVWDAIEGFAGIGRITQCLRIAGHKVVAFDINLDRRAKRRPATKHRSPMNILSPSGMAMLT
jgi:hypothetical protein